MPKPLFFTQIEPAWRVFTKNLKLLPVLVLVDFIFYYILTRIQVELFIKAGESVKAVSNIIQSQVQELSEAELVQLSKFLMQNPEFVSHYKQIIKYIGLFLLSVLLIWIVLKGINWFLTGRMLGQKISLKDFALKFILLSLFWFVFYLIIIVLLAKLFSGTTVTIFPLISAQTATAISFAILLFITYFSLISFAKIEGKGALSILKDTFATGFKKIKKIIPAYILTLIFLFVTATLPMTLFKLHYMVSIAFIILVTLPALTLSRIYFISVIRKTE